MCVVVNGEKIDEKAVEQEFERLRPDYERVFPDQNPQEQKKQLMEWSTENIIEQVLVRQQAAKRDFEIPAEQFESTLAQVRERLEGGRKTFNDLEPSEQEQIKDDIRLQLKVDKLLEEIYSDTDEVSAEQISEFYAEHKEEFTSPEQIRVGHIVKHLGWQCDEQKARSLMSEAEKEIHNGAMFESLVTNKYSDCADNPDLGYITRGQMAEEFEDVVFNMAPGQVSDVFRTRFGFHIAKVYDRREERIMELEEVKDRIVQRLQAQAHSSAVEKFVDNLKTQAEIKRS